jgi:trans-aconitate methyltransferase
MTLNQPRLYSEFASWFHLLSSPSSYVEEAEFARQVLTSLGEGNVRSLLELGSGGGNNAFHLKSHFRMALTDLSADMLALSRTINPECEHVQGDMRTLRLGREFDAIFIHDAVCYLTTRDDLVACIKTALVHCRRGGVVLFMPDFVRERFRSGVHQGGHDGEHRSLRYLEWTFDPDPSDTTYTVDFVYMLREGREAVRVEHDTHMHGLFSREEWLTWMQEVGLETRMMEDPYEREVFVGIKK